MTVSYRSCHANRQADIRRSWKSAEGIDSRLASREYESASEVVRAALRALVRQEEALTQIMRRAIVAYRVVDQTVQIVRVFHAGRDYDEEHFE